MMHTSRHDKDTIHASRYNRDTTIHKSRHNKDTMQKQQAPLRHTIQADTTEIQHTRRENRETPNTQLQTISFSSD